VDYAYGATRALAAYRDIFADRLSLAVGVHGGPDDARYLAAAEQLARTLHVPLVATNDVHYHHPRRRFLQDVLTCVREQCSITDAGKRLLANAERHLKSRAELYRLFADHPHALRRTLEMAERCTFSLDELRYEYPESLCPPDCTPTEYLVRLTWAGARERYPGRVPAKVRKLIEHELTLIQQLAYEPYFLTVWDIVGFARSRHILCQGRGSAANSAVCYCLGITSVDPERVDVLFERFVSAERNEPPDIDVDFEHERREEVFQYIYEKYGRDRAGIVAEVISYRPRSAIRDVGKALGLSLDRLDALAKRHDWWQPEAASATLLREVGLDPQDRTVRLLVKLVRELLGFPRHLSQHVGGFVITRGPLCELVPIENAAMPGRTFIEWDKDDIDALGILKIDCLALGMLTAIRKCFDLVNSGEGDQPRGSAHQVAGKLALHTIPPEDPVVYNMICRADTVGVFQIESRAQMSMLPRLRPRCFYDLVIEVAIVRPGPIQGDMVHPYLRRRNGEEAVSYPNDAIRAVLHKTLGVPLFQEQAMRLVVVAAGFTPGEADQLRRAMGAWRSRGNLETFHRRLIDGMVAHGLPEEFAQRCFDQICGFGEYGFPESHAASFALLVYVSAWLKRYHPAAFCAAVLNAQPMGFYQPAQLVRDADQHGVRILQIDVNLSGYDCRLETADSGTADNYRDANVTPLPSRERGRGEGRGTAASGLTLPSQARSKSVVAPRDTPSPCPLPQRGRGVLTNAPQRRGTLTDTPPGTGVPVATWGAGGPALRLGMRLVRGVSAAQVEGIERARQDGPFRSVADLARRSGASRVTLAHLAAADALRSLGLARRQAVWQTLALMEEPPLWADLPFDATTPDPLTQPLPLPDETLSETVAEDYYTTGLSLNAHPLALARAALHRLGVQPARVLRHARQGEWISVAGLVLVRQRPGTAKGVIFYTLEDETGQANLIVRPRVYERYRPIARGCAAVIVDGRVERQGEVVHVQVSRFRALTEALPAVASCSRDFH